MFSSWFLLVTLATGALFVPPLRAEHRHLATWLRPADATVWYRPAELAQINQQWMRQANAARGAWRPPVLRDLHREAFAGAHGWIVTRTECFETPDGPFVTTIAPNQPVAIIGTGRDRDGHEWVHVVSRRIRGWIRDDAVAHLTIEQAHAQDEWLSTSTQWLTVIAPEIRLGTDFTAEMGTRVRRISTTSRGTPAVKVPIRRPDGTLGWRMHPIAADMIGRDLAHAMFYPGTVPPSRANTLRLAWRFLGQPWELGRTDCSGLLVQIAEAMGLTMLARHSGDQIHQGRRVWSDNGTPVDNSAKSVGRFLGGDPLPHALARLGTEVLLLGKPGHMALYLGARDGAHWILHAVEGYGVIVSPLSFKQLDTRFTTALSWGPVPSP